MVDEGGQAKVVVEITKWNGPLPAWMVEVFIDKGEGRSPEMPDRMSSWWVDFTPEARDFYWVSPLSSISTGSGTSWNTSFRGWGRLS